MATLPAVFPMVSVRNPWGFLIQKGFKKIENRKKDIGNEFINKWIALHVAKTFKSTEQKYAQKYLKNHKKLIDNDTNNNYNSKKQQNKLTKFWGSTIQLSDTQKINNLINDELKSQLSHIIAFIKISQCVNSIKGKEIDPIYSDQPFPAKSHWIISDLIPLKSTEYITARGHMGCAKINDKAINNKLYLILTEKLKQREIEEKTQESQQNDDDDAAMIELLDDLDNDYNDNNNTQQTQQQSEQDSIESFSGNFVISQFKTTPNAKQNGNNKRKYQEIINDDIIDEIDTIYSPPMKKLKTNNNNKQTPTPRKKFNALKITPVLSSKHSSDSTSMNNNNNNNNNNNRNNEDGIKRKLPGFVSVKTSPRQNRMDWVKYNNNNNNNNNDKKDEFQKFSRKYSVYDMKQNENKIDLMIPQQTTLSTTDSLIDSDIDKELDVMLEREKENKAILCRLNNNPNELRRKEHLRLPDEYTHRVIVFDTETACFKPEGVIIDIGGIELINGRITGRKFQSYIKPWAKIHDQAMKVHGITQHFLNNNADGDIYQIIQSFMEWIHSDCICNQCKNLGPHQMERKHKLKLVAHNAPFDIRHLNGAINHCQAKMNENNKIWKPIDIKTTFDTQTYFRTVLNNPANYSLDGMAKKFGVRTDSRKHAHGALIDAIITAKCLQKIWKQDKDIKDQKCRNRFFVKRL